MEIISNKDVTTIGVYSRQGNDKNGNGIWLVNIFQRNISDNVWYNKNFVYKRRTNKYGDIICKSCDIAGEVEDMINS